MRRDILSIIENALELEQESLKGHERLNELDWGSIAVLSFMAAIDEKYAVVLAPKKMLESKTIDDLIILVENEIQYVS